MQIQCLLYILGSLVLTSALNLSFIYGGRLLVGFACAFSTTANVPYLNEVAPPAYRGRLSSMFELMIVFGALLGSVSSTILAEYSYGWRIMFFIPTILALCLSLLLFLLPESPKWLFEQGNTEDAAKALNIIYVNDNDKATSALEFLKDTVCRRGSLSSSSLTGLHDATAAMLEYRLPLFLIVILMALGQLTGSVVVRNFAPTIFSEAGFARKAALIFNTVTSIVNLAVVTVASRYVDQLGRRLLLTVGFLVSGAGMLLLSLGFILAEENSIPIFLCGCILTSAGFNMGFGPVGWILSTEMFPTVIKGRVVALSTIVRNTFEFATNFLFLLSNKTIHVYGTFFVFAAFCVVSIIFVRLFLVESKELESDEILRLLRLNFSSYISVAEDDDRYLLRESIANCEGDQARATDGLSSKVDDCRQPHD